MNTAQGRDEKKGEKGMKALLLLAFGGPRCLDEVEPFLIRLFKGQKPSPDRIEMIKRRYQLIGGSSPLPEITRQQAMALEEILRKRGYLMKGYVGMRYGHPLIEETIQEIIQKGIKEVIALPMTPFQSRATIGPYVDELNRVVIQQGNEISVTFIKDWHLHPLFIEAVQEKIEEGLGHFTPEERKNVHLLFTAHSLPKSMAEIELYVRDIKESVMEVVQKIGPHAWEIAFQSRGQGSEDWLGPDVESLLFKLSKEKVQGILVVPIAFVADHIEVLYDIDILYRDKAESLGMVLKRASSLNQSKRFIEALAAIVEDHIKKSGASSGETSLEDLGSIKF